MKTYNHLIEKVADYDNLSTAIDNASKKKKHRKDVQRVLNNRHKYILKLIYILLNGLFFVRYHTPKIIQDGYSRKERKIIQPDFIFEQIVHHAVMQILVPIFMKSLYKYTCGSIPKRGNSYGKRYINKIMEKDPINTRYVAKLDIKHFFQNINHDILKQKLRRIISDKRMLDLLDIIIDSYDEGIPIGYYTSQWFANFYLQSLDYHIKQNLGIPYYVRFMDDMILFAPNKEQLHYAIDNIKQYLNKKLDLELKNNYQVFRVANDKKDNARPIDFMGFLFYRNMTFIRKNIMLKCTKKIRRIKKKKNMTWYDATQLMASYGWIKHTNTYNVFQNYWTKNNIYVYDLKKKISNHQRYINSLEDSRKAA